MVIRRLVLRCSGLMMGWTLDQSCCRGSVLWSPMTLWTRSTTASSTLKASKPWYQLILTQVARALSRVIHVQHQHTPDCRWRRCSSSLMGKLLAFHKQKKERVMKAFRRSPMPR